MNKKLFLLLTFLLSPFSLEATIVNGGTALENDPAPVIKKYNVGDLVLIQVQETSQSNYQRNASGGRETEVNAKLAKWVKLSTNRTHKNSGTSTEHITRLKPSAVNEPEVEYESDSSFRNEASEKFSSTMRENIYCRVSDVRPNGNLYVVGHKEIRELGNVRTVSFSGEVSKEDLEKNMAIPSFRVFNMKLEIIEKGSRINQTEKNLVQRIIEWFWPF